MILARSCGAPTSTSKLSMRKPGRSESESHTRSCAAVLTRGSRPTSARTPSRRRSGAAPSGRAWARECPPAQFTISQPTCAAGPLLLGTLFRASLIVPLLVFGTAALM
jgi:hypothetical protein